MSMASRLKEARKFRGYTQEALAKAVGVSRGVISNIEYEKAAPQALVIRAICEVLHRKMPSCCMKFTTPPRSCPRGSRTTYFT